MCAKHHKIIESKTVRMLNNRTDYENLRKELKVMIGEIAVANHQDEVI